MKSLQDIVSEINLEKEHIAGQDKHKGVKRFFDILGAFFFFLGFGSLVATFFTEVTLVQATCFFIIGYIVKPTDGDRYESLIRGMVEDLGHIRAHLTHSSQK